MNEVLKIENPLAENSDTSGSGSDTSRPVHNRQPAWRAVLGSLWRGPKSRKALKSLARRSGSNDPLAVVRWLERRRFVAGDGVEGYRITISGVGALVATQRRAWRV